MPFVRGRSGDATLDLTAGQLFRRALVRRRGQLAGNVALLVQWQVCETLVPVFIGLVVDRAVLTGDVGALLLWVGAFAVLFTVLSNSYRFGARLGLRATQAETHALRLELSGRALSPAGVRTSLTPGEILSLATADADRFGAGLGIVARVVAALSAILVATVLLLSIDLRLGLLVLGGSVIALVLVQLLTPRISRHADAQQETVGKAAGMASDFVRGLRPLKGIGAERAAADRYRSASAAARDASIRTARSYGELAGVGAAVAGVFLAVVALLAGRLALSGEISVGELIAVVGLAQFLAEPLGALADIGAQAAGAHASASRIASFLRTAPLRTGGSVGLEDVRHGQALDLVLEDVHYGALLGLSFATRPGELVAATTTDPATADDLVRLLRGEESPGSRTGGLRVGGVPLDQIELGSLRGRLVVAPHQADVMEGTLRSNIGRDMTDEVLEAAMHASAATDLLAQHAHGLDHATMAGGSTLSGGQRQRLALARALAADPPLLVLSDPTTAVDAVTEQRISLGLKEFRHGPGSQRATLLLTTSPALLGIADRVVFIQHGRAAAQGTHRELVALPAYREAVLR